MHANNTSDPRTLERVTFELMGLDNGGLLVVEQTLAQQAGVHFVYVCGATEMVYVVYDSLAVQPDQLVAAVEQAGFHAASPERR